MKTFMVPYFSLRKLTVIQNDKIMITSMDLWSKILNQRTRTHRLWTVGPDSVLRTSMMTWTRFEKGKITAVFLGSCQNDQTISYERFPRDYPRLYG